MRNSKRSIEVNELPCLRHGSSANPGPWRTLLYLLSSPGSPSVLQIAGKGQPLCVGVTAAVQAQETGRGISATGDCTSCFRSLFPKALAKEGGILPRRQVKSPRR